MSTLSPEWLEQEAAENSHSAVQTAYELGSPALAVPVLASAAESYANHLLQQEDDITWRGPELGNNEFCSMTPISNHRELDSIASIFREANMRNLLEENEYLLMERIRELRNEVLNQDAFYERQVETEEEIEWFEDLLGYEGVSITSLEEGGLEQTVRDGSIHSNQYMQTLASTAYRRQDTGEEVLLPVTVIAYNCLGNVLGNQPDRIENWAENLEYGEGVSDPERYIAFENQRHLAAHSLETYAGLEHPGFVQNLEHVLDQAIDGEGDIGDLMWR